MEDGVKAAIREVNISVVSKSHKLKDIENDFYGRFKCKLEGKGFILLSESNNVFSFKYNNKEYFITQKGVNSLNYAINFGVQNHDLGSSEINLIKSTAEQTLTEILEL